MMVVVWLMASRLPDEVCGIIATLTISNLVFVMRLVLKHESSRFDMLTNAHHHYCSSRKLPVARRHFFLHHSVFIVHIDAQSSV